MTETFKAEMVFVKEECGGVDTKKELGEEKDPLGIYIKGDYKRNIKIPNTCKRASAFHYKVIYLWLYL